MAKFRIYKLHFTTPLHLGDARDDYSISLKTVQSDSMYAALTSCLAKIGKEIPVGGDLGFAISNLFPYYQESVDAKPVFFFPRPLGQSLPTTQNLSSAKKIRKVKWLDLDYFQKVLNGTTLFESEEDLKSIHKHYLTCQRIQDDFIKSEIMPRVNVSRAGNEEARPFYLDRLFFRDNSGLFFIACGDTSLLDVALDVLSTEGIGTDRNVGNGFFEYDVSEIELSLPTNTNLALSLSTFIPSSKEELDTLLEGSRVAYELIRRGGWITTNPYNSYRKNAIYAFDTASVFSASLSTIEVRGAIVDLSPKKDFEPTLTHPIWRCGKSIFIPLK